MHSSFTPRLLVPRHLVAAMATAAAVVLLVSPAVAAHDGGATITAETTAPAGDRSVAYVIRAVWNNDGHAAVDATATVVAESSTGERLGPVPMQPVDDDGRYTATLDFPSAGQWTVRFTVVTPPGTLELAQTIPAATPTPSSPGAATDPTSTAEPPETTATPDSATDTESAPIPAEGGERPTSTASAALFFGIMAAIVLVACVVAFRSRGARRANAARRAAAARSEE